MAVPRRQIAGLGALALLASAPAPAAARTSTARSTAAPHALLTSKELWATIDVCNAKDQPNTVGIRGSMPGDGQSRDKLYMSFRLQYFNRTTAQWVDLSNGANTGYFAVGAGAAASRQDGSSFVIAPVPGKPAFTLRGVVDYQWRRGRTVLATGTRPTTAHRQSVSGSDPPGYSAATCLIG
jgi:hypothetical protein